MAMDREDGDRPDDGAQAETSILMIGELVVTYDPLTREEIEATCPETEALLARSTLVRESREI